MRAAGLQPMRIVMDTNVFVAALRSGGGWRRRNDDDYDPALRRHRPAPEGDGQLAGISLDRLLEGVSEAALIAHYTEARFKAMAAKGGRLPIRKPKPKPPRA